MKICLDCKDLLALSEFHRDSTKSDGLASYCKPCKNARARSLAERNKTRTRASGTSHTKVCGRCHTEKPLAKFGRRQNTADGYCFCCKPCWNAKAKGEAQYNNPEYVRQWQARNADKVRANKRKFLAKNPGYLKPYRARYRALKRAASGVPYTAAQIQAKIAYWGGRCWICKQYIVGTIDMDHVKPLSKGGLDCLANLRPACPSCNRKKHARWPFAA